jgi:hypothetical protein
MTTTVVSTVRDGLNSNVLGIQADAIAKVPLGELFAILLPALTFTETGVSVTSNVATLAAKPSALVIVQATAGSVQGVKKLVRDPLHVLATGEAYWDGNLIVNFAAIDAVSAAKFLYAKADLSDKVSILLQDFTP